MKVQTSTLRTFAPQALIQNPVQEGSNIGGTV
jgi:hypothetical protein